MCIRDRAYGTPVNFKEIYTEGITGLTPLDIAYAKEFGFTIKLLAIAKYSDGEIEARVHPTMVPSASQIAKVDGAVSYTHLWADSVISTMKVLWPPARLSDAPTLVKMRSVSPILASVAGTKLPICAINVIRATCRR